MKVWGWVVIDEWGKPLYDSYKNVLLFLRHEDAKAYCPPGGGIYRVVAAKVASKPKPKKPE